MAATFIGTIVKFEEDGVWLSPIVNGVKVYSPTEYIFHDEGYEEIPAPNVTFNDKGEFKLPYESPRVITPKIPDCEKTEEYIGKFCLYISAGMEFIAVEIGDDAFELSSNWH